MRFTDLLFQTLLEEVKNKALFTKLMSGWRQQKPNLTDEEGEEIFNAFARIQNGLRPDLPQVYTFLTKFDGNHGHSKFDEKNLKNLPAYTYEQIRFLIDEYSDTVREREVDAFSGRDTSATPERVEASKNLWFGGDNLIFQKDGLRVYDIKNEQMSIRYGYWYHVVYKNAKENAGQNQRINDVWCVTWRPDMGKTNMWGSYRGTRSFYYVIDESKSPTNKFYISAIQKDTSNRSGFKINSMFNDGDNDVTFDEIVNIYPQLAGEEKIFKVKPYSEEERTTNNVVGQINERPGSQYEFRRVSKQLKKAYIDNGGSLTDPNSWKAMDTSLRNLYILFPQLNRNNVFSRFGNFSFINEIKRVGNEFRLLDNTLKQKGIDEGVGAIYDHINKNEFKVARISADNKSIRIYESKRNGKYGLYDISKFDWVNHNGVYYEPLFDEITTDIYVDSEGETYIVESFGKSGIEDDQSFYVVYNTDESKNPQYDGHILSARKWKELQKELSPEDGTEPESDEPSNYSDIKEKRGY